MGRIANGSARECGKGCEGVKRITGAHAPSWPPSESSSRPVQVVALLSLQGSEELAWLPYGRQLAAPPRRPRGGRQPGSRGIKTLTSSPIIRHHKKQVFLRYKKRRFNYEISVAAPEIFVVYSKIIEVLNAHGQWSRNRLSVLSPLDQWSSTSTIVAIVLLTQLDC